MPIKINPTADRCVDDDDLKRRSFYRAVHLRCYQAGKQGIPLTEIHVIELIKEVFGQEFGVAPVRNGWNGSSKLDAVNALTAYGISGGEVIDAGIQSWQVGRELRRCRPASASAMPNQPSCKFERVRGIAFSDSDAHINNSAAGSAAVSRKVNGIDRKANNVLHASDIMEQTPVGQNGRLTEIRCRYECEFYVHAVALLETLETITGNAYRIEQNGHDGWLVTV
jgi:hypothetical protein